MRAMSGYDAVMQVAAREDAKSLLPVLRVYHMAVTLIARRSGDAPSEVEFSPGAVESRPTGFKWLGRWQSEDPGLIPLCDEGVLERVDQPHDSASQGFFRMPDPDGVGRALDELKGRATLIGVRETRGKRR